MTLPGNLLQYGAKLPPVPALIAQHHGKHLNIWRRKRHEQDLSVLPTLDHLSKPARGNERSSEYQVEAELTVWLEALEAVDWLESDWLESDWLERLEALEAVLAVLTSERLDWLEALESERLELELLELAVLAVLRSDWLETELTELAVLAVLCELLAIWIVTSASSAWANLTRSLPAKRVISSRSKVPGYSTLITFTSAISCSCERRTKRKLSVCLFARTVLTRVWRACR